MYGRVEGNTKTDIVHRNKGLGKRFRGPYYKKDYSILGSMWAQQEDIGPPSTISPGSGITQVVRLAALVHGCSTSRLLLRFLNCSIPCALGIESP